MSGLKLLLFGPPRVELNGQPVNTERRKALALLTYLAVTGASRSREALATLFWPDYDQSRASAYLRRTLWELNQMLGEGWVEADREAVTLARRPGLDVDEFRARLALGRPAATPLAERVRALTDAAALYRDHFLAGFSLKDAPDFDEWVFFQAEGLKRDLAFVLETLVRLHLDADPAAGLEPARRWLALDPLNEAAHRALMMTYARSDQTAAALRQYDECVRVLRAELSVAPSAETTALAQQLRAGGARPAEPAPAPAATSRAGSRLPAQATPFVGRASELEQLAALLADPDCRLVTLTGPGGVGKTRLALKAAEAQQAAFKHGVYFVPLAPVQAPDLIISAIADAVGFRFFGQVENDNAHQLYNFLRERELLLVLDNFEHLITGAPQLSSLLEAAPRVRLLVTSRERLNLQEEWLFAVTGLPVPGRDELAAAAAYGAVHLFTQTARKANAGFKAGDADLAHIVRICRLVDGLPLGIELAAAWTRSLSAAEIAAEIERSVDFLASPLRNVPARHQSLRAVFEYSWHMLTAAEQAVFPRLALFWGSFQREAAEEVAEAGLPVLAGLVDKSLLYHLDGRYALHEAVRQLAAERLRATPPGEDAVLARHSAYFGRFIGRRRKALGGHGQRQALVEVSAEIEDIRAGFRWAVAHAEPADVDVYLDALCSFYDIRSRFEEAFETFSRATADWEARGDASVPAQIILGRMLAWHGWFGYRLSKMSVARGSVLRGLEILRGLGEPAKAALAFVNVQALHTDAIPDLETLKPMVRFSLNHYLLEDDAWGIATLYPYTTYGATFADFQQAKLESIAIFRSIGDDRSAAMSLSTLGENVHHFGDFAEARRLFEESISVARELGDRYWVSLNLDWAGWVARQMGDFAEARRQHTESLAISREIGDQLGVAGSLDNLGLLAFEAGDLDEAERLFGEGLEIRRATGHGGSVAVSLEHFGRLALARGDWARAEAALAEALALSPDYIEIHLRLAELSTRQARPAEALEGFRKAVTEAFRYSSHWQALEGLAGLAEAHASAGADELAVTLMSLVDTHPASDYATRQRAARLLAEAGARLSPERRSAAEARGRTLALDASLLDLA